VRLARVGPAGQERPVVLVDDHQVVDVSDLVPDITSATIADGAVQRLTPHVLLGRPITPLGDARIGPPVAAVGKVVGVGLNYAEHADEAHQAVPDEPVLFLKDAHAIVGPDDDVWFPRGGTKLDWEVELAVVIGTRARYADRDALSHVAGYCIANDVSERAFQLERGGQWDKGKSCETFCPLGPWLVTPDEVPDPQDLDLWLDVNDEPRQRGRSADMIFGVTALIEYISRFMVLNPGDVVLTGTPSGVALGMTTPQYLRPGDRLQLGIDGLGEQHQTVVPAP
jgi:2-keto-4-pentenoate hydratase/2-oxohepta-3-ene-1,7-dioic acid hydratase in catechol pathway